MKPPILKFLKDWLPPAILKMIRNLLNRRDQIRFEGPYHSWDVALSKSSGYDASHILEKVLSATLKVKDGECAFERDSVLFDEIQYSWPVTAGLLLTAARCEGRLSVLDFGGSLGSSYFQNIKFISYLRRVRWSVIEQDHFVEVGKSQISNKHLYFYKNIEECISIEKPNAVLLSSVLQYMPKPFELLDEIINIQSDIIIIDRTPVLLNECSDVINLQITPSTIYAASYPIRYFAKSDLLKVFEVGGYELVEHFDALDKLDPSACWMGFIFKRKA